MKKIKLAPNVRNCNKYVLVLVDEDRKLMRFPDCMDKKMNPFQATHKVFDSMNDVEDYLEQTTLPEYSEFIVSYNNSCVKSTSGLLEQPREYIGGRMTQNKESSLWELFLLLCHIKKKKLDRFDLVSSLYNAEVIGFELENGIDVDVIHIILQFVNNENEIKSQEFYKRMSKSVNYVYYDGKLIWTRFPE